MLYDFIRCECENRGISVRKLEIDAELKNGTISKWNKCSPTVDSLNKVATVLKVSVDYLLKGAETFKQ